MKTDEETCGNAQRVEERLKHDDDLQRISIQTQMRAKVLEEARGIFECDTCRQEFAGKNNLTRAAALMDLQQVSEVIEIIDDKTFKKPIYAGSCIATVKSDQEKNVLTIRTTAFDKSALGAGSAEVVEKSEDINELNSVVSELLEAYNNLESIQVSAEHKDNLDIDLTAEEIELISGKIIDIRQSLVQ